MRNWCFYFILFIFSIWLGLKIHADPGVVFIHYQNWNVETTLWFALLSFLIIWVLWHVIWILLAGLMSFPKKMIEYFRRRSKQKSQQEMLEGFSLLLEGEGAHAEKYFIRAAKQKMLPFMNYLLASMAFPMKEDHLKRSRYLEKAERYADHPDLKAALEFFKIKLDMESECWTSALSRILPLYEKKPHHPTLLRWLKQIYLKMGDWERLYKLLPSFRKVLPSHELKALEIDTYEALLSEWTQQSKGSNELLNFWRHLPSWVRTNNRLMIAYVEDLKFYGLHDEAEKVLVSEIKRQFDKELVIYYSFFDSRKADKQLSLLESVVSKQSPDEQVLFYLGRLCAHLRLWGKAEFYLNKSIEINPTFDKALFELGRIFLQLGNRQKAMELWSRMNLSSHHYPKFGS